MTEFGPDMPKYTELTRGVRRIVAPNPSMMTGPGTNSYLIGINEIAVIDPGPQIDQHIADIQHRAGAPIRWILATHTHPDHSPAVAALASASGAEVLGLPAPPGEHQDRSFQPSRILADGERLESADFVLQAIATPGHASNHLCFLHCDTNWIITGDHVIDGSTVVINPPDGNMRQYLQSLARVKAMQPDALLPGHGGKIDDPSRLIDWIIDHRLQREQKVLAALRDHPDLTTSELVPLVYKDVPEKLYGWAERSLLAHLIKLEEDGVAERREKRWFSRLN